MSYSGEAVIGHIILEYVNGADHRDLKESIDEHTFVKLYWEVLKQDAEAPTSENHFAVYKILFINECSVIVQNISVLEKVHRIFYGEWDAVFHSFVAAERDDHFDTIFWNHSD